MDEQSQHAISFLSGVAIASERLHDFGYSLYLQTGVPSWSSTQSRTILLSGSPFHIHKAEIVEKFDRWFGIGFWLDHTKKSRRIDFGVDIAYRSGGWFVQSYVGDEGDKGTNYLWNSEEYWTTSLDDVLRSLERATDALIQSSTCPTVAAVLEKIRRP